MRAARSPSRGLNAWRAAAGFMYVATAASSVNMYGESPRVVLERNGMAEQMPAVRRVRRGHQLGPQLRDVQRTVSSERMGARCCA